MRYSPLRLIVHGINSESEYGSEYRTAFLRPGPSLLAFAREGLGCVQSIGDDFVWKVDSGLGVIHMNNNLTVQ
jgi:hypothetical protein